MLAIVLMPIVLIMMVLNIDVGDAAYENWFDNDGDGATSVHVTKHL